MPNSFDSNFTRKLARVFLDEFESDRVLSKTVNTQLLQGKFDPSTGTIVDFKRPVDYRSIRTADGNITSGAPHNFIITGKASGIVQDYITVDVDFDEADEALKMDQLPELLKPAATRIKTDLEVDFAEFMLANASLLVGDPDTGVTTWDQVARAGALMKSLGIASGEWNYVMNPYSEAVLAGIQRQIGAVDSLVKTAFTQATINSMFAGMRVMTGSTLASMTPAADTVGALTATPTATYASVSDSMEQTLAVDGFGTSETITAGSLVTVAGVNRVGLSTRKVFLDQTGAVVPWTGVVVADVTMSSGAGNLVVAGPAVFEANGQFNTVDAPIENLDVITVQGTGSQTVQPNMFYHKNAFAIGSVPIKKLYSTDTLATTEDGLQIRVSKFADGLANKQIIRFDLRPAFSALNPFMAGQGGG